MLTAIRTELLSDASVERFKSKLTRVCAGRAMRGQGRSRGREVTPAVDERIPVRPGTAGVPADRTAANPKGTPGRRGHWKTPLTVPNRVVGGLYLNQRGLKE